jgi:acyl-CoA thioester hydrolase
VQFYETDLMGIVHHGNYIRFCEEARVAWSHEMGMLEYRDRGASYQLTVLETHVRHIKPCFFGDQVEIQTQACLKGVRLVFEYKMFKVKQEDQSTELVCEARTIHVGMNEKFEPTRPLVSTRKVLEKIPWIETWLLNL